MTEHSQARLISFKPQHPFFVGIDSDGCVFDTMEIKHKECFIPKTIELWDLQAISKYVRRAAEFVNLYSQWRGINRFPALTKTFDLLRDWPEPARRAVKIPEVSSLEAWIQSGAALSNPALEREVARTRDPVLALTLDWSNAVNQAIAEMVHGIPPFPLFRDSMEKLAGRADMICVSQTPSEALEREWAEHDIARYVAVIAGQEMGSKTEHLRIAARGKYEPDRFLMIGDAPGDLAAARGNGALFYPITPGYEEDSWERFHAEAIDRFLGGTYAGDYQKAVIVSFEKRLPATPPWKR